MGCVGRGQRNDTCVWRWMVREITQPMACFLPDLSRDKSGRACLPLAGAFPRPPSQARPDFPASGPAPHPLASGLRLQPTDRVTVHWTVT